MKKSTVINKLRKLPGTQDFNLLRCKGIEYIESLASDLWTDYNSHDPGITILEVLCYALTDLGYRTRFPIADLLARDPLAPPVKDFFTAAKIMTCNPVTILDLRKLLIDVEGIQNAWLQNTRKESYPAFYYKCREDRSLEIKTSLSTKYAEDKYEEKFLGGLYNVSLQLDEDDDFGDLNTNVIEWNINLDLNGTNPVNVKIILPPREVEHPVWPYGEIDRLSQCLVTIIEHDPGKRQIQFDLQLTFNGKAPGNNLVPVKGFKLVYPYVSEQEDWETLVQEQLKWIKNDNIDNNKNYLNKSNNNGNHNPHRFAEYYLKRENKIYDVLYHAYCKLHRHRNLCEDYAKFSLVNTREIAVCAEIRVKHDTDIDNLMARIYFEVDRYLAPPVRFFSLKEMLENGYTSEDIFDGPIMEHGFIDNTQLANSELRSQLHVSDLSRIILSMDEVIGIDNLVVTDYLNGIAQTGGEKWFLDFHTPYHLNLVSSRSKIVFYRDLLPFYAHKDKVEEKFADLKAADRRPRFTEVENDLPVPEGEYRPIFQYYSIQNDFPLVYGVGKDGLPASAGPERQAQANQLKGFLMFFDQLLANYLAQLYDVKNQCSVSGTLTFPDDEDPQNIPGKFPVKRTIAVQHLYKQPGEADPDDFPNVAPLFNDFVQHLQVKNGDAAPVIKGDYLDQWNQFTGNQENHAPENAYLDKLGKITESEEQRLHRRNRFLDHLIARFGESFTDYALLMYHMSKKKTGEKKIIRDKEDFLTDYPYISSQRGKGIQLKCTGDSGSSYLPNVPGMQNRVCKLLGITNNPVPNLAYSDEDIDADFIITGPTANDQFHFELQIDHTMALKSADTYKSRESARAAVADVIEHAANPENYTLYQTPKRTGFQLKSGTVILAAGANFASSETAKNKIRAISDFIKEKYHREGMYMVEHILLRPIRGQIITAQDIEEGFFHECLTDNRCVCPTRDYYSFRITVVLPYWPQRFRDMDFRRFVEKTIRMETPAHIVPKICWIAPDNMIRFETAYNAWREEVTQIANHEAYKKNLSDKINSLIKIINNLASVYPKTVMHDCKTQPREEDLTQKVILGRTQLGSF